MSVERHIRTRMHCDMDDCLSSLEWGSGSYMANASVEDRARQNGWRKDKIGRHICPDHPKLKGARRGGR